MSRFRKFIRTTLIGGLLVILPTALTIIVFTWLFNLLTNIFQPITDLVVQKTQLHEIVADIIVLGVLLVGCFLVGFFVRTRIGKVVHLSVENRVLKIVPGFTTIKEIVLQFLGKSTAAFSGVALVKVYENDTLVTAFITDKHEDGHYTVFVPTGPNPTSGFIYHLRPEFVHVVNVPLQEALRTVISCGAGSAKLFRGRLEQIPEHPSKPG